MDSTGNTFFTTLYKLDRASVNVGDFLALQSGKKRDGWIHLDLPLDLNVNGQTPRREIAG